MTGQVTGNNYLQTKLPAGIFSSLNPLNIALALVVIALGVMLYGFIAGSCIGLVVGLVLGLKNRRDILEASDDLLGQIEELKR